jgi:hypothetical protein
MAQTKVKLVSNGVVTVDNLHTDHGITTDHVAEGSVLYYTDARVSNYLTTNNYATEAYVSTTTTNSANWDTAYSWGDHSLVGYLTSFTETDPIYTASSWYTTTNNAANWNTAYGWGNHASQGYATQTYVNTAVAGLVDAAPATLDTLNELAAALGDDPNFATTVSTSIGTKWTQDNTKISNWDTAYSYSQVGHLPLTGGAINGAVAINSNTTGLTLNRGAVTNYNGIYYSTANSPKWFVGMRENLSSNNHIHYSEQLGVDVLTLDVSNGNATFYGTLSASGYNKSNWDTAYSWGNHASAGYLTGYTETDTLASVTARGNTTSNSIVIGGGAGGNISGLSVQSTQTNSGPIVAKTSNYNTVWSILPWDDGTYISTGIYYDNGQWVHASNDTKNALINFSGNGARWYASDTSSGSWNLASNTPLWDSTGRWNNNVTSPSDVRAPIFYDSNNTGYYVDPTNSSSIYQAISFGDSSRYSAVSTTINGSGAGDKLILYGNVSNYDARVLVGTDYDFIFKSQGSPANKGMFRFYSGNNATLAMEIGADQVVTAPNSSMRSPIFYDSNDTGYYVDPNGSSKLNMLNVANAPSGRTISLGSDDTSRVYNDTARSSLVINAPYYPHLYINATTANNTAHGAVISMTGALTAGGYRRWGMGIANSNPSALSWGYYDNQSNPHYSVGGTLGYTDTGANMWLDTGGNLQTTGSMRSTIFYDSADTNYYLNPAGTYSQIYSDGSVNGSAGVGVSFWSQGGNGAIFSFHRGGVYAVNMGLDSDNVIRIGGWSAGGNRLQMDMSGNLTMAGDVTAYSDARVKENVVTIDNALDKVKKVRGVYYNRTDSEDKKTKIGVIAQELLEVVPEVVNQDNDGMYNVSYGNITALLIEAIKEQNQTIEDLKKIIAKLEM